MSKVLPEVDPTSIGNVLISMSVIDPNTLKALVAEFHARIDMLLGQYMVSKGVLTEYQLDIALLKQQQMRGNIEHETMVNTIDHLRLRQKRMQTNVEELAHVTQEIMAKASNRG